MLPTIIVASVISLFFVAIVANGIRNRKKGKRSCSCGGGCGSCGMNEFCCGNKDTKAK